MQAYAAGCTGGVALRFVNLLIALALMLHGAITAGG